MAYDGYCSPTLVRTMCRKLTTARISDDEIEAITKGLVDPIIDAALKDQCTVPMDPPPNLIAAISALMTIGYAFDDAYSQTGDESQFGQKKREQGMDLLEKIQTGELDPGNLTDPGVGDVIVSDPDEDYQDHKTFVGTFLNWKTHDEYRESDGG